MNERFLGSVSAFIRRCFEYADPDHPNNKEAQARGHENGPAQAEEDGDSNAFAIGDDEDDDEEEEDLLVSSRPSSPTGVPTPAKTPPSLATGADGPQRKASRAQSEAANAALDPANPLHITLPTFRMVVLADELLEQFFESAFPASFHVVDGLPSQTAPGGALTTFASLGLGPRGAAAQPGAGKGLRGVLDGIVTDGMRVATEVRRRMEEAQRELEKNAVPGGAEEDDEEDEGRKGEGRGVRSEDRDLLSGADAEAAEGKGGELVDISDGSSKKGVVEFEN